MEQVASTGSATPAAASSGTSKATIAQNFDAFLLLLTTQLRNQNPLEPLNTNEFTQQLVQFSSVEQQVKMNDNLSSLLTSQKTQNLTNALGFVGARVRADGSTSTLRNGTAQWSLNAPRATNNATLVVKDSTGNQVFSQTVPLSQGEQAFTWNGLTSTGGKAPDGDYTLLVTAKDPAGQPMAVKMELSGLVDQVDVTGSEPVIRIGSTLLPLSKVKSIERNG